MYPSRQAVAQANLTEGIPKQPNLTYNSVRQMLRPGSSTRPLSSHLNKIVVFKDGGSKAEDLSAVVPSNMTGIKVAMAQHKDLSASYDFRAPN